jgi:small subunit ribosomal protein S20
MKAKGDTPVANHKSALKRSRQNEVRRLRNKSNRTRVKNAVKDVRAAAGRRESDAAAEALKTAKSVIDKAAKKGSIHSRTAARKVSRLSRLVNTVQSG